MMQNSGLGNAVSPLTSLNFPFKIPVLVICTLRGEIGLRDEPQHELMGQITTQLFEDIKVPWEYLPTKTNDLKSTFRRIDKHFKMTSLPFALIMKKGTCKDENRLEQKERDIIELEELINLITSREQKNPQGEIYFLA